VREELLDRGGVVLEASPPYRSRSRHTVHIMSAQALPSAARDVARVVDDRIADGAYGVEAMLACLAERRPDIPQDHLAVVGYSAGAIIAPAVSRRLGERVGALVLVGAGADLLGAAIESSFGGQPLHVEFGFDAKDEDVARLRRVYLEHATLDPYHTAPAVARRPVLLILARSDSVFPAAYGELLRERLGRPDTYRSPFGHVWLFFRLPAYREELADWLDENVIDRPHASLR